MIAARPIKPTHGPSNPLQDFSGGIYNQLQSATSQQKDMTTLYSGFISNIQDTNLADAATQLQLNQTALQAALQVTSTLNQLTLLNYLPVR